MIPILSLSTPSGFTIATGLLAVGGPLLLNTFSSNYIHGGIIPDGGADINVNMVPLYTAPLDNYIDIQLNWTIITYRVPITVSGVSCTQVFYTDSYEGTPLSFNNEVVYCPSGKCKMSIGIIAFFVASAASAEPYDPQAGSNIDTYLEGQGSPIAGNGPVFFSSGVQWDVDPRLIVAIAGAESSFGTQWVNCPDSGLNAWSWFYNGTCQDSPFTSFAHGIMTVTKFMRLHYFDTGQTTIQGLTANPTHRYCVTNCASWVGNVTNFYTAQGGDTKDLTFHIGPYRL